MAINKTLRILSVYHLFTHCQEVSFQEVTDLMPLSKKTIYRDICFLKKAGLIRIRYSKKANAFIPMELGDTQPEFPENKTQRLYMERIIRLCTMMRHMDPNDPPGWYREQFPGLSERTRQRDFDVLRELGFTLRYVTECDDEPSYWEFEAPGTYGLRTFTVKDF